MGRALDIAGPMLKWFQMLPRKSVPDKKDALATNYIAPRRTLDTHGMRRSWCGSGARKGEVREELREAALLVRARVR